MLKVVGYQVNEGEFKGYSFKNVRIYCLNGEAIQNNGSGFKTDMLSVKYDNVMSVCQSKQIRLDAILNKQIRPYYNKYGKVESFELID